MTRAAPPPLRERADGRLTWQDVETARDAALASTDARWHDHVRRAYAATKALAEAGTGTAITVEAVGGWCQRQHGGPTAQSIRNNPRLNGIVRIAAEELALVAQDPDVPPQDRAGISHRPMVGPWRARVYRLDRVFVRGGPAWDESPSGGFGRPATGKPVHKAPPGAWCAGSAAFLAPQGKE